MNACGRQREVRGHDEGAAAVEFALIAVIFVMLLAGVLQFGYTFFEYIEVAHAAREGVRWAALGETAQVTSRALAAAPGLDPSRLNVTVTPGASSDAVRVTARYVRTQIMPFPNVGSGPVHGGAVVMPNVITSVAEARME
ncbi:MAG: hypothetical protein CVT67_05530 [Actinobacteria bacterium HGW-Actinobacteria-7]|jgi:Flp pilus assembly protein TadG|nr:MAG: hypothetical protein CVT67_05530 [Actinobacteria bacterium HGW-Actinobacteria-7]